MFHSGTNAATAASIFEKMDEVLRENEIPWANCVGASVDNASVNLGKRNSIFTRAMEQNPAIYFMGCPCHIIHNTCMKAAENFTQVCVCKCNVVIVCMCLHYPFHLYHDHILHIDHSLRCRRNDDRQLLLL